MKIFKYWAKSSQKVTAPSGERYALARWHGSDASTQDAQMQADMSLAETIRKVKTGAELGRYSYGERALREEISQVIRDDNGKEIAIVTRNLYGALVLNAARVMFIDIDFPEEDAATTIGNQFRKMFGNRAASPEQMVLEHIGAWWEQHRELGLIVYRTAAGMRCLVTNEIFEPTDANAREILQALYSDPLYIRLCQAQGCFRARLTPKPWRCGVKNPPVRFPFENAAVEARFRKWEEIYARAITQYTTCRRLQEFGTAAYHPDVARILQVHDAYVSAERNLRLA